MGFGNGGLSAQGLFQGAMTGLSQGIAQLGLSYLTEEFDLPPLLANIGFSAISLGIEGLINGSGIFEHIFGTYEKNALSSLGYNPMPEKPNEADFWTLDPSDMWIFQESAYNDAISQYNRALGNYYWQQSVYMSQIMDFADITIEQGIVAALNTYATGFFNSISVNSMVNIAGSVGDYIVNKLNSGDYSLQTMRDGSIVKVVTIEGSDESALISDDDIYEWLKGKTFEGGVVYGDIGVNPNTGDIGITDGYIDGTYGNEFDYYLDIGGANYSLVRIDQGGQTVVRLTPADGKDYLALDGSNGFADVTVEEYIYNRRWGFVDSEIYNYSSYDDYGQQLSWFDLSDPSQLDYYLFNPYISYDQINSLNLTSNDRQNIINYILFNGIDNPCPEGMAPSYMSGFGEQLALADPNMPAVSYIPLYEWQFDDRRLQKLTDGVTWFNDVYLWSDEITNEITTELNGKFSGNLPQDMVGFAFSGSGDPLLQALNKDHSIDMKSVILLATPLKNGRIITNPNVENVISVAGSLDLVAEWGTCFQDFEGSPNTLNKYKIVINGVGHSDYSYDQNDPNASPTKVKTAEFLARLMAKSNDNIKLQEFLDTTQGVSYDSGQQIYTVNLEGLVYND